MLFEVRPRHCVPCTDRVLDIIIARNPPIARHDKEDLLPPRRMLRDRSPRAQYSQINADALSIQPRVEHPYSEAVYAFNVL